MASCFAVSKSMGRASWGMLPTLGCLTPSDTAEQDAVVFALATIERSLHESVASHAVLVAPLSHSFGMCCPRRCPSALALQGIVHHLLADIEVPHDAEQNFVLSLCGSAVPQPP